MWKKNYPRLLVSNQNDNGDDEIDTAAMAQSQQRSHTVLMHPELKHEKNSFSVSVPSSVASVSAFQQAYQTKMQSFAVNSSIVSNTSLLVDSRATTNPECLMSSSTEPFNPVSILQHQHMIFNMGMEVFQMRQSDSFKNLSMPILPRMFPASNKRPLLDENDIHRNSEVDLTRKRYRTDTLNFSPEKSKSTPSISNENTEHKLSSFKAILKNGELIKDDDGYLIVTPNVKGSADPLNLCIREHANKLGNSKRYNDTLMQQSEELKSDNGDAINLKLSKNVIQETVIPEEKSPVLDIVKIAPKLHIGEKNVAYVAPKDAVDNQIDVAKKKEGLLNRLFPMVKSTSSGSLVLWNFLWALLHDKHFNNVIKWISSDEGSFYICDHHMLAFLWGQIKENPTMNWEKIDKVLQLYVKKDLLRYGQSQDEYKFLILPKPIKESGD